MFSMYATYFLKIVSNTANKSCSIKNQINVILKELKQGNVSETMEIYTRGEKS